MCTICSLVPRPSFFCSAGCNASPAHGKKGLHGNSCTVFVCVWYAIKCIVTWSEFILQYLYAHAVRHSSVVLYSHEAILRAFLWSTSPYVTCHWHLLPHWLSLDHKKTMQEFSRPSFPHGGDALHTALQKKEGPILSYRHFRFCSLWNTWTIPESIDVVILCGLIPIHCYFNKYCNPFGLWEIYCSRIATSSVNYLVSTTLQTCAIIITTNIITCGLGSITPTEAEKFMSSVSATRKLNRLFAT